MFCEKGVFEIEHTERIIDAGKAAGLEVNIHADEIKPLDGCKV